MPTNKKPASSEKKSISIGGDVKDSVVIVGDKNVVTKQTTIIQKFFNIFKSDSETLEHRNRRILLNHVENAWIKGVLDASLHGAALLDLGIKQDPEAVTKYPWAIKKESTDETLPVGTSMLEIFDSIGMGRSLLILGAPGSGKTTMLLELARQLIQHAREDVTYPIPMVFNLASWTEKLTLADWLAQELNNLYSVPRKTAPDWVKGNKLLLLLDGLDEVRQDDRAKCVEAINAFRKQNGLTSLAVCSRSQDYADLNAKLAFEGAIEVQPLTQGQITEFFNRFGKEMAGIKQVLKKDGSLREMAETPLFLSIMIMTYRDKQDVDILVTNDEKAQRKRLFDNYIERMFESHRSKKMPIKNLNILHWLSWLAGKMIEHKQVPYLLENMELIWLTKKTQVYYKLLFRLTVGLIFGLIGMLMAGLIGGVIVGLVVGLSFGLFFGLIDNLRKFEMVDTFSWSWKYSRKKLLGDLTLVLIITGLTIGLVTWLIGLTSGIVFGSVLGLSGGFFFLLSNGLSAKPFRQTKYPGQRIAFSIRNFLFVFLIIELICGLGLGLAFGLILGSTTGLLVGLLIGLLGVLIFELIGGNNFGGFAIIQYYTLLFILARNNLLPWKLIPFLDHCVDLIFLRRVGGGYIFVHRLLMEHFSEMYVDIPTSKGN